MNKHKVISPFAVVVIIFVIGLSFSCSGDDNSTSSNGSSNPPPANAVNIAGLAFSPTNLTVKAGTTVTWTNNDAATHTVTSDNGAFTSSGNLKTNDTYQFTFMTAGSYPYHCTIHPSMQATITVTP